MHATSVVPRPVTVSPLDGAPVQIAGRVGIAAPAELENEARYLRCVLEDGTGVSAVTGAAVGAGVTVSDGAEYETAIVLALGAVPPADQPEAYRLRVGDGRIEITGTSPSGVFAGIQTLRQLLPAWVLRRAHVAQQAAVVEAVEVVDWPRFSWRGVHLDVSRHFMPKSFLLDLVDLIALHKCNVLHLHLTDDQGWRVPISKYPRLTEVGAWRKESPVGHWRDEGGADGIPHGGYYSADDLREVVAYAAERHVTVLPEIDMPGHMVAAIAAYPELGGSGKQLHVGTKWGISKHVLNLEEATLQFCRDVIDEVCEMFPGAYFHIGGDECPTVEWDTSERARSLMAEHGFTDVRQLQGWFTSRIAEHLASRGRTLVGWDEILDGGAPPGSIVMSWQAEKGGIEAAAAGHDVVMAPQQWLYFDWGYSQDPSEPLSIGGATSVEHVYRYEPTAAIPEDARHHVLGAQCQLWTEYVDDPRHAEYLYFPRMCAFAEVAWSPAPPDGEGRDYSAFETRLVHHLDRLAALGVNYRPLDGPTPGQSRTWHDPA